MKRGPMIARCAAGGVLIAYPILASAEALDPAQAFSQHPTGPQKFGYATSVKVTVGAGSPIVLTADLPVRAPSPSGPAAQSVVAVLTELTPGVGAELRLSQENTSKLDRFLQNNLTVALGSKTGAPVSVDIDYAIYTYEAEKKQYGPPAKASMTLAKATIKVDENPIPTPGTGSATFLVVIRA